GVDVDRDAAFARLLLDFGDRVRWELEALAGSLHNAVQDREELIDGAVGEAALDDEAGGPGGDAGGRDLPDPGLAALRDTPSSDRPDSRTTTDDRTPIPDRDRRRRGRELLRLRARPSRLRRSRRDDRGSRARDARRDRVPSRRAPGGWRADPRAVRPD